MVTVALGDLLQRSYTPFGTLGRLTVGGPASGLSSCRGAVTSATSPVSHRGCTAASFTTPLGTGKMSKLRDEADALYEATHLSIRLHKLSTVRRCVTCHSSPVFPKTSTGQ